VFEMENVEMEGCTGRKQGGSPRKNSNRRGTHKEMGKEAGPGGGAKGRVNNLNLIEKIKISSEE